MRKKLRKQENKRKRGKVKLGRRGKEKKTIHNLQKR